MSYYGTIYSDEYLAHHGVKGMKWGVRKDRNDYRTTADRVKRFIRKNGKKIAIGAGAATLGAAAIGAGLGLATSRNARERRYQRRANSTYAKTNSVIERIQNNPDAIHIGNKYAKKSNASTYDVGRINAITGAIKKNSPRSNHKATARAQYTQNGGVSTRINNNPNAHKSGSSRAQYIQTNAVVERIKNNKNAYNAGNKYAKRPNR